MYFFLIKTFGIHCHELCTNNIKYNYGEKIFSICVFLFPMHVMDFTEISKTKSRPNFIYGTNFSPYHYLITEILYEFEISYKISSNKKCTHNNTHIHILTDAIISNILYNYHP